MGLYCTSLITPIRLGIFGAAGGTRVRRWCHKLQFPKSPSSPTPAPRGSASRAQVTLHAHACRRSVSVHTRHASARARVARRVQISGASRHPVVQDAPCPATNTVHGACMPLASRPRRARQPLRVRVGRTARICPGRAQVILKVGVQAVCALQKLSTTTLKLLFMKLVKVVQKLEDVPVEKWLHNGEKGSLL